MKSNRPQLVLTTLLLTILGLGLSSCKKELQPRSPVRKLNPAKVDEKKGTVDGGGGNIVCNSDGKNCSILDLVEDKDREPYFFDMGTLFEEKFTKYSEDYNKHFSGLVIYGGNPDLKFIFGSNVDFMTWILSQRLLANVETFPTSRPFEDIYGDESFQLNEKNLKSIRYYFTDKELPFLKDQGNLQYPNKEGIKQLALQDFDGNVLIQRQEFEKLDLDSKYALKVHESILYLLLRLNNKHLQEHGTAKIRKFVDSFVRYTYMSAVAGRKLVDITQVKAAFDGLELPVLNARYDLIGLISDKSKDDKIICTLKNKTYKGNDGTEQPTMNYYFDRDGSEVSDQFAMDSKFYMKVQIYLVNRGTCIFKPAPCEIRWHGNSETYPIERRGWTIYRNGETLPDVSQDYTRAQDVVLKNYQTARICQ